MRFRNGVRFVRVQILARGKQSVIAGIHPETKAPYAWSRELWGPDDVPTVSFEQFGALIAEFVERVGSLGWVLESGIPGVSAVSASSPVSASAGNNIPPIITHAPNSPASSGHNHPPQDDIQDIIADAKAILDDFPNREVPPGEKPNAIDEWLDDYFHWIDMGYMLAAYLGERVKLTPEARDLWCVWSDGRAQDQSSLSVWKSVIATPSRFGPHALLDQVRQYTPAKPDFPDLDPSEFPPEPPPPGGARATPVWDAMRARWAYSKRKGFIDMRDGARLRQGRLRQRRGVQGRAPCRREFGLKGPPANVANFFLRQPDRIEVFDLTYAPGDPVFVAVARPRHAQLQPLEGDDDLGPARRPERRSRSGSITLRSFLGSDQERDRFLKWCAFVAQHPELKPNWHFLVISKAGLGQGHDDGPAQAGGRRQEPHRHPLLRPDRTFNPWAERKLVIVGETARSSSPFATATEVNNRLKPLLAQPPTELTINRKNVRQYEIPNRCAVIMFSNDPNPLYLERNSRRVHVINRLGETARDQSYYEGVHKWLEDGGAELCAAHLLTLPLTDAEIAEFKGGVAPSTPDKVELEEQNVQPQQAALEDLIRDARDGITTDTPYNLVATAEELAGFIALKSSHRNRAPSALAISSWLSTMQGVSRVRVDPKHPRQCAVVDATINGVRHAGRLWTLAEKTSDGRDWGKLTLTEIVAIWKNLPTPASATVIPLKTAKGAFPDDQEPV